MAKLEKGSLKLRNAWAFYDWANSVYSLVIASAVFPIFYGALFSKSGIETVSVFGSQIRSTPLITYTTAAAFLVVAFLSPLLSGIADYVGNKKKFMKFFCYLGALSCMGLYFFSLENIYLSLFNYFLALVGFWGSLVFYNSYLPDVAFKEQQDSLSAKGFSLGYIGSVFLLLFNLVMVLKPELFGISGEDASIQAMKISFVTVGIWWIGFSQYSFYYLPSGAKSSKKVNKDVILNGFRELKQVQQSLSENMQLKRFLIAFFVYSMAVQTVMLVATYFGEQEINWGEGEKTTGLIVSILLIQLVAVFGSIITAKISNKIGNIQTLIILNFIWAFLCIGAYFIKSSIEFYIAAALVGMVMGGIQALSRSTFSKMIPETDNTTSYFSFYDVSQKVSIVFGMTLFAFVDQITGSMRNSILVFVFIFLLGAILLRRIKIKNY